MKNLLPFDGTVYYHGKVFDRRESDAIFCILNTQIEWKHDEVMLFGKKITTKRKMAWYGDMGKQYTYSSIERIPLPWTKELLYLKKLAEEKTSSQFNSCLLNYYASGEEAMGWHSDNESMLVKHNTIASFSFGAERKFVLKHKTTKQKVQIILEHGSFLSMEDEIQDHWKHALPKSMRIKQARINLTFRLIK
jgi:alkylated DNA repair dioxygenase AlkB